MSPVHVELAPADFHDWNALIVLLQTSFAYMDGRIDPPSSLKEMTEDDLRAKARREQLLIAREHGQLVGCAYAEVRRTCVYIGKVAVASEARGRGVARQLFAAAEAIAQTAGRPVIELQTRVELIENHDAFSALGFEKVGETVHPGYSRPTSITMRRTIDRAHNDA